MPELPEVETIRRDLDSELTGRTILRARFSKPDIVLNMSSRSLARRLRGRRFDRVDRRGKYLLLRLDDGRVLQVQLRMSGRFAIGRRAPDEAEFRHVAARFELDDSRTLFYDDVRRLGGFQLLEAHEWAGVESRLGPEPLEPSFTAVRLGRQLRGRRAPIKNALLDQSRVAGVGNIYASEALHRARLDPRRPAGELDRAEMARLHRAIRRVLRNAIADAGTTFRNYRAVNGQSGRFQDALRVYGREGQPCARCGTTIARLVQAGRSTFFCPGCQT